MADLARAFVPGHVTGFFTVEEHDDPTKAGSRGGGIVLSEGATVTVRAADRRRLVVNGEQIEMNPVDRVLGALDATAEVRVVTDLPIGAGFGVSGAVSLGTALAANAAFDRRLSENELCTIAHGAEVQAGTGLGDVVAQARGGVPIRLEPGGPQDNALDAIPARSRIEYRSFGEVDTAAVVGEETEAIDAAGDRALSAVVAEPTLDRFVQASRRFARESGLLTDRVRETIEAVAAAGGSATMAMLGETVLAVGTGLSDAGYDPAVCEISPSGASLERP